MNCADAWALTDWKSYCKDKIEMFDDNCNEDEDSSNDLLQKHKLY